MIVQKVYKCSKCKNSFTQSESERFVKSQLPTCPVCGAKEITLEKTLVVGKNPNK